MVGTSMKRLFLENRLLFSKLLEERFPQLPYLDNTELKDDTAGKQLSNNPCFLANKTHIQEYCLHDTENLVLGMRRQTYS